MVRGLRGQADAVAEELEGWARVPVQPLLSVYSLLSSVPLRTSDGICVAAIAQVPDIIRSGIATPPDELEQATSRLLEVLRPAA
jgi:hypothetical protein